MHKSFACEKGLCSIGYENVMHVGKGKKGSALLFGVYIKLEKIGYVIGCVLCMFDKYLRVKKIY